LWITGTQPATKEQDDVVPLAELDAETVLVVEEDKEEEICAHSDEQNTLEEVCAVLCSIASRAILYAVAVAVLLSFGCELCLVN
jgi:hypothetical protein